MQRRPLLISAAMALSAPVWANSSQVDSPLGVALQGLRPVGQTRLRVWGFEVYDATLFAAPGFDPGRYDDQRFALELAYLRSFDGADIAQRSIDEMREQATLDDAQAQRWLASMARLFPNVQRGDRITGLHLPGVGARFYLNGQWLGELSDDAFSRRFFGIWLSPKTSQPRMRASLLQSVASAAPRTP
jgi:hypothetical protein